MSQATPTPGPAAGRVNAERSFLLRELPESFRTLALFALADQMLDQAQPAERKLLTALLDRVGMDSRIIGELKRDLQGACDALREATTERDRLAAQLDAIKNPPQARRTRKG